MLHNNIKENSTHKFYGWNQVEIIGFLFANEKDRQVLLKMVNDRLNAIKNTEEK